MTESKIFVDESSYVTIDLGRTSVMCADGVWRAVRGNRYPVGLGGDESRRAITIQGPIINPTVNGIPLEFLEIPEDEDE